jgi:glycogen debranching enzyme
LLKPLLAHVWEAGVGSISEIFDGNPPHFPRGTISQAWSVAEVLRVWEKCRPADNG